CPEDQGRLDAALLATQGLPLVHPARTPLHRLGPTSDPEPPRPRTRPLGRGPHRPTRTGRAPRRRGRALAGLHHVVPEPTGTTGRDPEPGRCHPRMETATPRRRRVSLLIFG